MSRSFYRFNKTQVERVSALQGADSWYSIQDDASAPLYACHVIGNCLGGTTTFHRSLDDEEVLFRLEPRRKVLNLTYFVAEGADGPRLARLDLFAGRGMKVRDADGRELYRVVDPKGKLDKLMQDVLESSCSEYAIVEDRAVIGSFERRERPAQEHVSSRGLLGRFLDGVRKALNRDWCVELAGDGSAVADHRPLLAAMILLMEQTIASDRAA